MAQCDYSDAQKMSVLSSQDYWLSYVHKKLVGQKVLNVQLKEDESDKDLEEQSPEAKEMEKDETDEVQDDEESEEEGNDVVEDKEDAESGEATKRNNRQQLWKSLTGQTDDGKNKVAGYKVRVYAHCTQPRLKLFIFSANSDCIK